MKSHADSIISEQKSKIQAAEELAFHQGMSEACRIVISHYQTALENDLHIEATSLEGASKAIMAEMKKRATT